MADIFETVKNLPPKKIGALVAVIALTTAALILGYSWFQKADYQLLYANLGEEDAGQIIQKLSEMRIPYAASPGGVMVPADKVYELRLQLASQGLPQGGSVGFELFDKTSFTMSDFVQKLNYRRALQGELARTIRSLSEVEQCRVHLAVPEKSLFMQKEERPKASVLVKLRTGRKLSQGQVQGIVHLVSSSVEGLDPKDVSVIDNAGEMMTSASDETFASAGQLDYQRGFEKEMEARVVGMLEPVVGKGKVRAKAAASIDFTKIEKTEEKYDPDSQVIRSEQRNVEKSSNVTAGGGGVPGVASNLPERAGQQTQAGSGGHQNQSEKKNETVNYEISKIVSHVISPSGEIKRLSIVALVDGTYAASQGSNDKKYMPRTEEEIRQLEDMVKKAVGFNADRGDEVKVVNMPFEAAAQEETAEVGQESTPVLPVVIGISKYVVPLAAGVLLFLFVIKPLMKVITGPTAAPRERLALPQSVAEIQRALEGKEVGSRDQLIEWARKNPKEATSLVKGWLEER